MTGRGSATPKASTSKNTQQDLSPTPEDRMKTKLLNKLERDVRALQRNVASSSKEVRQNIAYSQTTQTPFIRDRLNTSFEVGYTTAREKLDDKCMEIYHIP